MINRLFKKFHIRYLYFWSMTIFVVLLFAVVIWSSYYFSVQNSVRTTSGYQERILTQLNAKLGAQFALIESISLSIVRNNELMDLFSTPKEPYENLIAVSNVVSSLQTLTFSTPSILNISLYVHDAPVSGMKEIVRFFEISKIENETWYPQIEQSEFAWIGEHKTDSYQGEMSTVSFARKLYSSSDDYLGIVMINMKAADVQKLLLEEGVEPNRQLIDSGGRLITQVGKQNWDNDRNTRIIADAKQSTNGYRLFPSDSLIVWTKVKGSDWLLVERTQWEQLVAGSARLAWLLLIISIATVFALILFFLFLNRKFTEPIFLMLQAMKKFPSEEGKDDLPSDYQNEYGQLFHGYRKLLHKIEELYESIRIQFHKQKESEISALQAMINPHFLYNTLDQLNWMAIKDKNTKMSRVLELTGRMLRIGLSNGNSLILLSEELELIESYIQIQQIRLGNDIHFVIESPNELLTCYVPKMTMQPFIENCIRHGFHGRKHGNISVRCEGIADELIVAIEDDGKGLDDSVNLMQSKTKGGYGIRNVKERMIAFFGTDEGVEIANRADGGTIVTLRFPLTYDDEQHRKVVRL